MSAVSRHGGIAVKIQSDRYRLRAGNSLEQFREKIIGNWEVVFRNVVFRYFDNDDTRVHSIWSRSPGHKFVVTEKLSGLKQPNFPSASYQSEHANAEHKAHYRGMAKYLSELRHQTLTASCQ